MNVLLKGRVGSHAYGLETPESDEDFLGVFAAPTESILGLHPPKDSQVSKGPDTTMHEARKFLTLCLGGNPTAFELLWLDSYEIVTSLGAQLIDIRETFLGATRVRAAYLGYAWQQFQRMSSHVPLPEDITPRAEKNARHLVRLVLQGQELYNTGKLTLRLRDPEYVRSMGVRIAKNPSLGEQFMQRAEHDFSSKSPVLPEVADKSEAEQWLLKVRRAHWKA